MLGCEDEPEHKMQNGQCMTELKKHAYSYLHNSQSALSGAFTLSVLQDLWGKIREFRRIWLCLFVTKSCVQLAKKNEGE